MLSRKSFARGSKCGFNLRLQVQTTVEVSSLSLESGLYLTDIDVK